MSRMKVKIVNKKHPDDIDIYHNIDCIELRGNQFYIGDGGIAHLVTADTHDLVVSKDNILSDNNFIPTYKR